MSLKSASLTHSDWFGCTKYWYRVAATSQRNTRSHGTVMAVFFVPQHTWADESILRPW